MSTAAPSDPRVADAIRRRPPLRLRPGPGLLVALSGMDGSGKSSAIDAIVEHLSSAGLAVKPQWNRLGEAHAVDKLAAPLERVLGRRPRRGPVAWLWVLVVALVTVRSHLMSAGLTRRGVEVVCDRWTSDAMVDLEIRFGRRRAAEWLLRAIEPRADVNILLEVDAATAAARKPDDQPRAVLDRMERLYERAARVARPRRIDATRPQPEVLAEILEAVDAALSARG